MAMHHVGQKQLKVIDNACRNLGATTQAVDNPKNTDVYRLLAPDLDEGLKIALMPYDSLFRNGSLPWGNVPCSDIQDYMDELEDAWDDLFSTLTRRLSRQLCRERTCQHMTNQRSRNLGLICQPFQRSCVLPISRQVNVGENTLPESAAVEVPRRKR